MCCDIVEYIQGESLKTKNQEIKKKGNDSMKKHIEAVMRKAKKQKLGIRALSLFLSLVLLFLFIPATVYVEAADAISSLGNEGEEEIDTGNNSSGDSEKAPIYTYTGASYEEESLREETVKHFRLENGSYVAADYGAPVHIFDEDNQQWVDIDNTLYDASGVYASKDARIKFQKKVTGNEALYTLKDGNTKLTLSLNGAKKGTAGVVTNSEDAKEDTELQKLMNLEKLSSSILYQDILDGVDIEYVANALSIKENIIVKERKESYSYTFTLSLNGMSAVLCANGDIQLIENGSNSAKYTIPAPVVFDASGRYAPSKAANYSLLDNGNHKYTLTVSVSSEWMNDEERAFPVTVDPVVRHNSEASPFYILSANSSGQTGAQGKTDTMTLTTTQKGYMYYNFSGQIRYDYISSVELYLYGSCSSGSGYVGAYETADFWDNGVSWDGLASGQYGYNDIVMDYREITDAGFYSFDITRTALYVANDDHYSMAILFELINGNKNTEVTFSSAAQSTKPYALTTYRNMSGIESYWPTSTHSVGTAGNGTINLANGNLTFVIPLMSTTDSLMPYTVSAVYNQTTAYGQSSNGYMPAGYSLNIAETISKRSYVNKEGVTEYYYIHTDADGTEHAYFKADGSNTIYIDEDGLQKTLELVGTGITITDDNTKEVKTFTAKSATSWYMSSIADPIGNKITVSYDTVNNRPTALCLVPYGMSSINMLSFAYGTDGILAAVYNPATMDAAVLRVSDQYGSGTSYGYKFLRQVDFCIGSSSTTAANYISFAQNSASNTGITVHSSGKYVYNDYSHLISAEDVEGNYRINYSVGYDPQRSEVYEIKEYDTSGDSDILGNKTTFYIGNGYTTARLTRGNGLEDIETYYYIDDFGRVINTYVPAYSNGVNVEYSDKDKSHNSISSTYESVNIYTNYLLNSEFKHQPSGGTKVVPEWNIGTRYSFNNLRESDRGIKLVPAQGYNAMLSQNVTLENGTYTFSLNYGTHKAEQMNALVDIQRVSDDKYYRSINITTKDETYLDTFSTTFEIDESSSSTEVKITVYVYYFASYDDTTDLPYFYVDNASLMNTRGAPELVNCVKNGAFTAGNSETYDINSDWQASINSAAVDPATTDNFIYQNGRLGIKGAFETLAVTQRVYTATETQINNYNNSVIEYDKEDYRKWFSLSARVYGANAVINEDAWAGIRVDVWYYKGIGVNSVKRSFFFEAMPRSNWLVMGVVDTLDEDSDNSLVEAIDISCVSSCQLATVYFDDIAFVEHTKNPADVYSYNELGFVDIAYDPDSAAKTYYTYNQDNYVTMSANDNGEIIKYTYDSLNRLLYEDYYTFCYFNENEEKISDETRWNYTEGTRSITPLLRSSYEYNNFGQIVKIQSFPIEYNEATEDGEDVKKVDSAEETITSYEYAAASTPRIWGALLSTSEASGDGTRNFYNANDGRLMAAIDKTANTGYTYIYDSLKRLVNVYPALYNEETNTLSNIANAESVTYTYDGNNNVVGISTPGTTYSFSYCAFGETQSVAVGNSALVSYEYNGNGKDISRISYGNGFSIVYVYNSLGLVSEVKYIYPDAPKLEKRAFSYEYTSDGKLSKCIDYFSDNLNGTQTEYYYNSEGNIKQIVYYGCFDISVRRSLSYSYDARDRLKTKKFSLDYEELGELISYETREAYSYNSVGLLSKIEFRFDDVVDNYGENILPISYTYDNLNRLALRTTGIPHIEGYSIFKSLIQETFEYRSFENGKTDNLVEEHKVYLGEQAQLVHSYKYDYDSKSYITKITNENDKEIRYFYDDIGQLIREDNEVSDCTYVYTYDNSGNILSKTKYALTSENATPTVQKSSNSYTYSSGAWGDQLVSFGGGAITYDSIGNPVSYYNGMTFNWNGRQLETINHGSSTYTFTYNSDGLLATQDNEGIFKKYTYEGNLLISEERYWEGSTNHSTITYYFYDSAGSPVGFRMRKSTDEEGVFETFFYEKNIFGDIVRIYDTRGNAVVEYTYDAWGNYTMTELDGSTSASKNRLLYRGYYYDDYLGFYYLGSRYYDANTGRFISPDDTSYLGANGDINSYNLYAYCRNNPVMYTDPSGHVVIALTSALVYAVVAAFVTLGVVAVAEASAELVTNVAEKVIDSVNKISSGISNLIKMYAATLKPKKQYDSKEGHHIVAKRALRAMPARMILDICQIGLDSKQNLVDVEKGYHRVLHTNMYYCILNATILAGYIVDGDSGVETVLKCYQKVLGGLS